MVGRQKFSPNSHSVSSKIGGVPSHQITTNSDLLQAPNAPFRPEELIFSTPTPSRGRPPPHRVGRSPDPKKLIFVLSFPAYLTCELGGSQKVVLADVPLHQKPERGHIRQTALLRNCPLFPLEFLVKDTVTTFLLLKEVFANHGNHPHPL